MSEVEEDVAQEVEGAVLVGLWASAARCLLQYVLAPMLGAFGHWLPVAGLLLQVLGCLVTVAGALTALHTRHRHWQLWVGLAVAVVAVTLWSLSTALLS